MTITSADGWQYDLTPEDRLWAARMILGESGGANADAAAVLWSMASRLAAQRGSSFTSLIRGYSQPINPIWTRSGSKCAPGGSGVGTDACSDSALARRDRIIGLTPDELGPELALFDRWAAGQIKNPVPKSVHFATAEVVRGCQDHRDCTNIIARIHNVFASTARSDAWPANFVTVGGAGDAPMAWGWVGPAVGVGAAALTAVAIGWGLR